MSVQSACVTRQPLERSGWLSAALSLLAIMGNLPPPKAKSQNTRPHFTLLYKTFLPRVRLMVDQSVKVNVRQVGGLSQALTENIQIEGKSDSFPPRFDPTDYNDFDLTKTEKSLTVAGVGANAQQITIQKRDVDVYELQDRFNVATNVTCDGTTFETRLNGGRLAEDAQPTVDLITDPYPFMITAGGKRTVTVLDIIPTPHSVNVCYSNMSRHRMSTETLGDDEPTMFNYEVTSGRLVIGADGGAATLDMQTMEDGTPESEAEFLIAFQVEGHTPITPKYRAVNTFTSDSATNMVVVKIMDDVTPHPIQHLVYLQGGTSDGLTEKPQAALKDGENAEFSVTLISNAPLSNFTIPPKFRELPADEAISSDDRIPASVSIRNVQESGSIRLQLTDDSMDKGYSEFLTRKIDGDSECWLNGNTKVEPSRFEIMVDNDKTRSNLLKLHAAALTEAADTRQATCLDQLTRRPKTDPTGTTPFGAADNDEAIAGINR